MTTLLGTMAVAAFGSALYAHFIEAERLMVTRVDVPIAGLDRAFDGFRLVQVSDVHGKLRLGRKPLTELVAAQRPDLVAITGDLINAGGPYEPALAATGRMTAPYGVFFVPGNNETNAAAAGRTAGLVPWLTSFGVQSLVNRPAKVERCGAWFWLIGVDDPTRRRLDDLGRAVKGTEDGRPRILMAHSPDILTRTGRTRLDYVIVGHTHGGQVCLPWFGPLITRSPFGRRLASGPGWADGVRAYVSRGLGTSLLPIRLSCPPEIVVHVLRAGGR
jgi:hypothetical protein